VEKDYDFILKNVPIYSKRKRLVGEIDLLGMKDGECDIYEVKCSHRIVKAKKQFKKIQDKVKFKVRKRFFFCGASMTLFPI